MQWISWTTMMTGALICMGTFTSSAALGNHLTLPGSQDLHDSQNSDRQPFIHQLETINKYIPPHSRPDLDASASSIFEKPAVALPPLPPSMANEREFGTPSQLPHVIITRKAATSAVHKADAKSHVNMGWKFLLNGHPQAAMAAYREALRHSPHSANAYIGMGITLKSMGNIERAKHAIQQALELNPQLSSALVHLGYLHADSHFGHSDSETARRLFNQAFQLGDPFARIALLDLQYRSISKF
jgi:tetratricopeptide (TPR) repeat protein